MKKSYRSTVFIFFFMTAFLFKVSGETPEIYISTTDVENLPYVIGEGEELLPENPGVTIEILRLIEKSLDIRFVITREPWARVLFNLENNHIDGIFHASFTADREKIGVYPRRDGRIDTARSLFERAYVLYVKKGSPLIWDGSSLQNLTGSVGVIRGYAIIDDLKRMNVPMEELSTPLQGMNLLLLNRIAAFAELQNSGDHILSLEREAMSDIVKLSPALQTKPYYLIFSREFYAKHTGLAERIWDEIHRLVASGEYDSIFRKYADIYN